MTVTANHQHALNRAIVAYDNPATTTGQLHRAVAAVPESGPLGSTSAARKVLNHRADIANDGAEHGR